MCNQISDTISSPDRSFVAHRHGENHHSKPLRPQAFLMSRTPYRIRGGSARSHAGAHEGSRDPRATRARDASQASAREGWLPMWPRAAPGLLPTECARRPASRRSPPRRVQQQERLSVLPMACVGLLHEQRSAQDSELGRHAQRKAREGGRCMGSRRHARARAGVCLAHLLTKMTKSLRRTSAARHLSQVAALLSANEGVGGRSVPVRRARQR